MTVTTKLLTPALIGLMATTSPALAEDQASAPQTSEVVDLEPVVISALRSAASIRRTGVAVTALDRATIARDGATSLAEVLARQPGVSFQRLGPFGSAGNLYIRGLGPSYIAVFQDGIRIDDPATPAAGVDFGPLLPDDIGRIEILRGSQSALWGSSAMGGVVSLSSLAALEDGLHQQLTAETGTNATHRLSYGLTQRTERAELALTATRFRTDGWSAAASGTERDGADVARLSLTGRYHVSEQLSFGAALFSQRSDLDFDDGFTGPNWDFGDSDARQLRHERGLRLFAEVSTGATDHVFDVTGYKIRRQFRDSNGGSAYDGQRLTASWQATSQVSDTLSLVYGLDATREEARSTNIALSPAGREVFGAFGQAIWSPDDRFDLSFALRRDQDSDFGGFVSARLAGAWHLTEDTTFRAALARGYRAPTLDERFAVYPYYPVTYGNPDLDPEQSRSAEIGLDTRFASGGSLSLTAFRIETDQKIRPRPWCSDQRYVNLDGVSVSRGLEVSGQMPLGASSDLSLTYTLTDARDPADVREIGAPRHQASVQLTTELTPSLRGSLRLTHVAGRKSAGGSAPWTPVELDTVTLLDAGLDYQLPGETAVYLRIENLTDEAYSMVDGYGGPGRELRLGLRAKF